jgi:hypothetical protein
MILNNTERHNLANFLSVMNLSDGMLSVVMLNVVAPMTGMKI